MIASVRRNLDDESSTPRWTTTLLTDNLNHSKDRVWTEVRKERKDYFLQSYKSTDGTVVILGENYATSNLALTASTTLSLTLPPDFAELRTLGIITSNYEWVEVKLRTVSDADYRYARTLTDPCSPAVFYSAIVNERTLNLAPMTDTALDTELVYVFQPADLTTGDTLQMPYPLYAAVEAYATSAAFAMDDDARAGVWLNVARDIVAAVVGTDVRQSQDAVVVDGADSTW